MFPAQKGLGEGGEGSKDVKQLPEDHSPALLGIFMQMRASSFSGPQTNSPKASLLSEHLGIWVVSAARDWGEGGAGDIRRIYL